MEVDEAGHHTVSLRTRPDVSWISVCIDAVQARDVTLLEGMCVIVYERCIL